MTIREYQQVFYTSSGAGRPFAKQYLDKPVEDVLKDWKTARKSYDYLLSHFWYTDDELMHFHKYPGLTLAFTPDWKYCVARRKHVPEGHVRDRYELEVLELKKERELSAEEEAFFVKLKDFRAQNLESKLCLCEADLEVMDMLERIRSYDESMYSWKYPHMIADPEPWTLDFGPLNDYMNLPVIDGLGIEVKEIKPVRAAIYLADNANDALKLANDVLGKCGCGRRLTDEELVSFGVNLERYHRLWPEFYMGEKNGYYFIRFDNCCAMTNDASSFPDLAEEVEADACAVAMFSGGRYRCGGRPV